MSSVIDQRVRCKPSLPAARLQAIGSSLYERISQATAISHATVMLDDWRPRTDTAHRNCSEWAERTHHLWSVVPGWRCVRVFAELPMMRFTAHCVMRDPIGKLWDITPDEHAEDCPTFLESEQTVDDYYRDARLVLNECLDGKLYFRVPPQ